MRQRILTSVLVGLIVMGTSASFANVSPYVAVRAGGASSSFDNGIVDPSGGVIGAAIGAKYAISPDFALRGEFEYSYNFLSGTFDKENAYGDSLTGSLDHNISTYLANIYVDLTTYKIKPYIGFGLGMISLDEDGYSNYMEYGMSESIREDFTYSNSAFAWGFNAGFGFNFTETLGMDIGIKYLMTSMDSVDVSIFNGTVGLRYTF